MHSIKGALSKRTILLLIVWTALILLNCAGLVRCIVRYRAGTLEQAAFSYSLLHFFMGIATISAIFLAEWLFRFRAGTPLVVCCMVFAFCGNCVANVWRVYDVFPAWDMVLHSLSGVLFAAVGLGFASLLLSNQTPGKQKALTVVLFTLFFSLSVGFLWEVFEFTVDTINPSSSTQGWAEGILESYPDGTYLVSSRRGTAILDTMEDMILHLAGSLVTLVPLLIAFLKKPARMAAFAFTPLPRRKKSAGKGGDDASGSGEDASGNGAPSPDTAQNETKI